MLKYLIFRKQICTYASQNRAQDTIFDFTDKKHLQYNYVNETAI